MSRLMPATAFTKAERKPRPKVRKMSIQKLDAQFSLCVREGADWTCVRCGAVGERGAQNRHCSHLHGRRLRAGRWNPLNAVCHCATCHMFLTENPEIFGEWIKEYLGDRLEEWRDLRNQIVKIRPQDREELYQHFKGVHAEMLRLRDMGVTGPIPFEGL